MIPFTFAGPPNAASLYGDVAARGKAIEVIAFCLARNALCPQGKKRH
jgi:hypothetical protein